MTYHEWGEEDFDWAGLCEAGNFIHDYCMKRARLCVHWKEKYGTLRYEYLGSCLYGEWPVHKIFYPGHLFYRWPKRLMPIDRAIGKSLEFLKIAPLVRGYQIRTLRKALFKAVEKYPHLEDEILSDAPEEVVGKEIHNRYWS